MTRSEIFKSAWDDARYHASVFGGKAKEYFSECLKIYWIRNNISGSWDQKCYAADLAYRAINILKTGAELANKAGKAAYANAALSAIKKIRKIRNAGEMIGAILNVPFNIGSALKAWHETH